MENIDEPSGKFEDRYRALFMASRDAIMTIEPPSWKFTSANPACLKMYGAKTEAEFTACEPWTLSPKFQPDGSRSVDKAKEMIDKAVREGSSFFEWTHSRLNGGDFLASVLLSKVEAGGRVFLNAVVRDITEQKRLEAELLEAKESRYKSLVDTALEGVWFLDKDLKTTEVNEAITRMLGYGRDELLGRPFMDFLFEDDMEAQASEFERRRSGLGGYYERRMRCKNGGEKWFLLSARPLRTPSGEFAGTFALFTDITEKKSMEAELKRSEAKFRSFFNRSSESMLIIGSEGDILEVNDVAVRRYGYSREEFLRMSVGSLDAPGIPTDLENVIKITEAQGYSVFERVNVKKDGTTIPVEVSCSSIEYAGQKALLAVVRDITERKRIEKELREKIEKLEFFNNVMMDREERIIGLKKEVEELKEKLKGKGHS